MTCLFAALLDWAYAGHSEANSCRIEATTTTDPIAVPKCDTSQSSANVQYDSTQTQHLVWIHPIPQYTQSECFLEIYISVLVKPLSVPEMVASQQTVKSSVPESSVLFKTLTKVTQCFLKASTEVKKKGQGQDTYGCSQLDTRLLYYNR